MSENIVLKGCQNPKSLSLARILICDEMWGYLLKTNEFVGVFQT